MEISTHRVKLNIEFKISYIYNIKVIDNEILILIDINKLSSQDRYEICNAFRNYDVFSMKYATLLVGISEIGTIDVNNCRLIGEEYLMKDKVDFSKSFRCKLNTMEKCVIISMFMPSN